MEIIVKTSNREEIVNITGQVNKAVSELWENDKKMICNKKSRVCLIYTPHTTCSISINEFSDENVCSDVLASLKELIPHNNGWKHDCEEHNADAHIKASVIGNEKIVPIENGKLQLGRYQSIGLIELDGPRERKILVQII